jgi:tRNA-dihydrouridine synthase B
VKIGPHILRNNLVVAPMAGVTDRPFRQLCKKLGAGMAVSEMVASNSLLWGSEKTIRRGNHEGEVEPKVVQIAGSDPEMMAEAAKYNVDKGADIIDINMGCPAKKICNVYAGSALLKDEPLVARVVDAVVKAVEVPVTLKIRTGPDPARRNAVRIARIAENAGIRLLAVHGRTRACGFRGQAEFDTIAQVKAAVRIPVIANGDIATPEEAARVLARTRADGIMIGRAAHGRPWIFREILAHLQGRTAPAPSPAEMRAVALEHLQGLYGLYGEEFGVRIARKHIGWYVRPLPGGEAFRREANTLCSPAAQLAAVAHFFDSLHEPQ